MGKSLAILLLMEFAVHYSKRALPATLLIKLICITLNRSFSRKYRIIYSLLLLHFLASVVRLNLCEFNSLTAEASYFLTVLRASADLNKFVSHCIFCSSSFLCSFLQEKYTGSCMFADRVGYMQNKMVSYILVVYEFHEC